MKHMNGYRMRSTVTVAPRNVRVRQRSKTHAHFLMEVNMNALPETQ